MASDSGTKVHSTASRHEVCMSSISCPVRALYQSHENSSSAWSQEGFPGVTSGKEPACQGKRHRRRGLNPWIRKISWSRKWQPPPVFLPGKFHSRGPWSTVHGAAKPWMWPTIHTCTAYSLPCLFQGSLKLLNKVVAEPYASSVLITPLYPSQKH